MPEENVVALSGGEVVEGLEVLDTPGHASHHVAYLDPDAGDAFVGDVGGVLIPPDRQGLDPDAAARHRRRALARVDRDGRRAPARRG